MNRIVRILIFIIVILITFSACQPTPDNKAVVNKAEGLEDKVIQPGQSGEAAALPDRVVWNETRTVNVDIDDMGDYTVTASMDAQMPRIPEKTPAYLIEPNEFSEDFMKKAAQYLMKGEIFDGRETKEDVMKELLDFKKDISAHKIRDGYQEQADEHIEFLNKRYDNAADGNGKPKFEYSSEEYGERWFHLKSYPDGGGIMEFTSFIGTDGFYFRINDFNRSFRYISDIPGGNVQANGVKTTFGEAQAIADKAMEDLFDEPFVMVQSDITDIINDNEYYWHDGEDTSIGQAYVFYYTCEYGGIPSLFIKSAPSWSGENTEYAKPYGREGACVVVDDRGISEMWYESYSKTSQTLNENVNLMPFYEVLEKLKDGIFYHNLWGLGGSTVEINITGIEFGMVREPVRDNPGQYMMVPAWNFIGNLGGSIWDESGCSQGKSILALSAIDGSIITDYSELLDPK